MGFLVEDKIEKQSNADIQGGPVLNVNNSPFDSPSKNKLTYIMSFS